jgi:nitrogen fixation/metabolism regulation signal transduction histidine kinase
MVFKNFKINILIRIVILSGVLFIIAYYVTTGHMIRVIYLGLAAAGLLTEFFLYVDRTNREMGQFLDAILYADFTQSWPDRRKGRSFRKLYVTMNAIKRKYESLVREKEIRAQYILSLIEQVQVGILSCDRSGNIHFVNTAFKEMLDLPSIGPGTDIKRAAPEISAILKDLRSGHPQLVRVKVRGDEIPFSWHSTGFKMEWDYYTLISVQNLQSEVTETEMQAWQKIIRVLTHEIMNSVTPISSLSGSLSDLLRYGPEQTQDPGLMDKLKNGLAAISDRSKGLLRFTGAYQTLARIPIPNRRIIPASDFLSRLTLLFAAEMTQKNIIFQTEESGSPEKFPADPGLLEQVMINLVRNAVDAVAGIPSPAIVIGITAQDDRHVVIRVSDNGHGIKEEDMGNIFIPFFTTRESGTGIGLSLSRQIVMMHRGAIDVRSTQGKGSVFSVILPVD